jgi:hypothetical protein
MAVEVSFRIFKFLLPGTRISSPEKLRGAR